MIRWLLEISPTIGIIHRPSPERKDVFALENMSSPLKPPLSRISRLDSTTENRMKRRVTLPSSTLTVSTSPPASSTPSRGEVSFEDINNFDCSIFYTRSESFGLQEGLSFCTANDIRDSVDTKAWPCTTLRRLPVLSQSLHRL